MRILLRLYPKAWRNLYGDEFAGILAAQRMSPRLLLDIIGGAVDARLQPQVRSKEGDVMAMTLLKRCAAGPELSQRDQKHAAIAMVAFSFVFGGLYILAAYLYRGSELVDALGIMVFPASLIVSMPFTSLKAHSTTAKIVTVGGLLAILAGLSYLATLI
jgi:hypothetical protein